jgi:hypothetical protein
MASYRRIGRISGLVTGSHHATGYYESGYILTTGCHRTEETS